MSALPTHVGNDIARVSLPIMTAARTRDLAKQLLKGCPGVRADKITDAPSIEIIDGICVS